MKTPINFYLENDSDVVATIGSANDKGFVTCYSRIGQHSKGHIDYFKDLKPALYRDYQFMLKELIALGYKLEIETDQIARCWRNPTQLEINFGYGAIHYADINLQYFIKSNGDLKKWIKLDGLRYNR